MAKVIATQISADIFLGLTKKGSQDLAENKNMIYQLISIDDELFFSYPNIDDPVRTDRIFIEIKEGKVVKASIQ